MNNGPERAIALAKRALADEGFVAAWAERERLSRDEATNLALNALTPRGCEERRSSNPLLPSRCERRAAADASARHDEPFVYTRMPRMLVNWTMAGERFPSFIKTLGVTTCSMSCETNLTQASHELPWS
jgi:hypothetical protein